MTKGESTITYRMLRTLHNEVSKFVNKSKLYTNEADFIRDATREKLAKEMEK